MTKYKTILADPPWKYGGQAVVGNGGRGTGGEDIIQVGTADHYPTMTMAALKALPIAPLADDKAHLYLWTTNSFMVEAHELARAWGFQPKTILTWGKVHKTDPAKPSMKCGYYFRSATEHIVFATRGNMRLSGPCVPTLFLHPRAPHSVKPDYFYDLIEQQSPGPYLELFARRPRAGWDRWGNEVESTVTLQAA
jgi:N6-adenosine-specific RNA methylase IME4